MILYEDQQSQLIWTPEISQILDHQTDSIHQLICGPQHNTVENFLVCVHSVMMNLTLKRLEFRGQVEWGEHPGWGGGVGCGTVVGWIGGQGMEYGV